jgi:hypothetical protein
VDLHGLTISRREALDPLEIPTEQLGFKAWRESSFPEEYVPIVVGTPSTLDEVLIVVRASTAMRIVEMEILGPQGELVRARTTVAADVAKGVPVPLKLGRPKEAANWLVKIGGETSFNKKPADVLIPLIIPQSR